MVSGAPGPDFVCGDKENAIAHEAKLALVEAHPTMDFVRKFKLKESEVRAFFEGGELGGIKYFMKSNKDELISQWDHLLGFTLLDPRRSLDSRLNMHHMVIDELKKHKVTNADDDVA